MLIMKRPVSYFTNRATLLQFHLEFLCFTLLILPILLKGVCGGWGWKRRKDTAMAYGMAQQMTAFTSKYDNRSSILHTHMVGENGFLQVIL